MSKNVGVLGREVHCLQCLLYLVVTVHVSDNSIVFCSSSGFFSVTVIIHEPMHLAFHEVLHECVLRQPQEPC